MPCLGFILGLIFQIPMAPQCYGVSAISTLQFVRQTQRSKDEEFRRNEFPRQAFWFENETRLDQNRTRVPHTF